MNFSGLKNSFYLTFLISTLIDITRVVSEVALTGGGTASIVYFISQTLIFAFVLRSVFIGILYDIIVNKVVEAESEGIKTAAKAEIDSSYIKTARTSPTPMKRSLVATSLRSGSRLHFEDGQDAQASPDLDSAISPIKSTSSTIDFSSVVKHAIQKNKLEAAEKNSMSSFKKFLIDKYLVGFQ